MVTFEGTQYYENVLGYGTHGDFLAMNAAQVASGYEFAPGPLPSLQLSTRHRSVLQVRTFTSITRT